MLQTTSTRPSARRTQAERRTGTRGQLLEATLQSMTELGYGATTTLEVERRAGVSRGARIHYFPTKADLMAAVVDHLFDRLSERYDDVMAAVVASGGDAQRATDALRQLWTVYQRPEYIAALELQVAARTDAELLERLQAVRNRQRKVVLDALTRAIPDLPVDVAANLIEACNASMLGLLMQRGLGLPGEVEDFVLGQLGFLVVRNLSETTHRT